MDDREAGELATRFEARGPEELLTWAFERFGPDRVVIVSSFQIESMALIDMAAKIRQDVRVATIDTGRLPQETYELMERVRDRYGIPVEVFVPDAPSVEAMVRRHGVNLFYRSADLRLLCCYVRKVLPLRRLLSAADAWVTGLRRDQSETRANIRKVEVDRDHGGVVKLNPLADWSEQDVWSYIREHGVPYSPLYDQGYTSIGCAPCTRPVPPGAGQRSGRWWWETGAPKECGMHCAIESGSFERQVAAVLGGDGACRDGGRQDEGVTVWLTGLSGAGKSTIAGLLASELRRRGAKVEVLDGDEVRQNLSKGLGFSREDRDAHIRRIGYVAGLLTRNGVTVIVAAISPYRSTREAVRAQIGRFVEVYVRAPLEVCAGRDVKGLYRRALAGEIPNFTGISDPYEEPLNPEVVVDTASEPPEVSAARVLAYLEAQGFLAQAPGTRAASVARNR